MMQSQFPNTKSLPQSGFLSQLVVVVFVLVTALLIGGYFYFGSSNSGVSVEVNLPENAIHPGDIFDMDVAVINNSKSTLSDVRVTLNLPKSIRLVDSKDRVNEVRELDSEVAPGSLIKETYKVVALPGGGSEDYTVAARANYLTESFSNEFERTKSQNVEITTEGFKLEVSAPEKVAAGEKFDIEMQYDFPPGARESLEKFIVIEGPSLRVVDSNLEQVANNRWLVGVDEDKKINASVAVGEKPSDLFFLKVKMVVEFGDEDYVVLEQQSEVLFVGSSLALSVDLEDPKGFVSPGEILNYRISYKNNTDVELKDALIKAQLVGDMFDFGSIQTSGTFDAISRIATWSSSRFSELRELGKGEEGSFTIAIKVKPTFPINSVSDKNFTLNVNGSIESPTIIQGTNTDRTSNFASSEVNVSGAVNIEASAYFRDADSGILNEGPFPPKIGQPTEYTIHWNLSNAGTDINNVIVRAQLEEGVSFTGEVNGTTDTLPILDASSNEVVWSVRSISATEGVLGDGPEAIFQISLTPGGMLLGQFAPLLGITTVSATDVFTGVGLLGTDSALNTALPDDSTIGSNQGKVIQ